MTLNFTAKTPLSPPGLAIAGAQPDRIRWHTSLARRVALIFLASTALFAHPAPAKAAMVFCNRTDTPIEAAIGYREEDKWLSEGWWQIEPGQCSRVFGKPFTQRFYFYYATALSAATKDKSPFVWSGKYEFCTDTKAFRIEGDDNCEAQGYQTRPFQQIDLGNNTHDYTLDFKDGSGSK